MAVVQGKAPQPRRNLESHHDANGRFGRNGQGVHFCATILAC